MSRLKYRIFIGVEPEPTAPEETINLVVQSGDNAVTQSGDNIIIK